MNSVFEGLTPNFPLLKRLNLWVRAQDKLDTDDEKRIWWQEQWCSPQGNHICGTAFCLAGAAIVYGGHTLTTDRRFNYRLDGEHIGVEGIPRLADQILGLRHFDGYYEEGAHYEEDPETGIEEEPPYDLYRSENTVDDIDRQVKLIFADHGVSYARTKSVPEIKIKIEVLS